MRTVKILSPAIALFAFLTHGAVQATDLTAVLLEVEGIVTVTERSSPATPGSSRSIVRLARPLQVVRRGDSLHVPQKSRVEFVCSTERLVVLRPSRARYRLDEHLCGAGDPLPPGSYGSLAPQAGRLRSVQGSMVLEREIRSPADEVVTTPKLLEPRNTTIRDGRPILRWTQVKGATEYLIEMTGDVSFEARLDASDVQCNQAPGWGDVEVCSIDYPESVPGLPPGARLTLGIAARRGIAAPWYRESAPVRVQVLAAGQAAEVRTRLDALPPGPGKIARLLLAADLLKEQGLLSDALAVYRDPALKEIPEVLVTLGDTYLSIGLLAPAAWSYQEARRVGGRPLVIDAAAEFGLGWIEYGRRNFAQAREHFFRSRDLYAGRGLLEEAAAAERAAEKAWVRLQ